MTSTLVEAHGARIPAIGFGTWQLSGETGQAAVETALKVGYRHVDTASMYGNEVEVGKAIKASGVKRDDIFLTTKVWPDSIDEGALQASAEASLKRLGVAQVDLLLIHWPNPAIPLKRSMKALSDARQRGLARHIGVSNFTVALLDEAVRYSQEPLACNQCEHHPLLDQSRVIAACRRHGVAFVAYAPIGRGNLPTDGPIGEAMRRHGKSAAQIALRWHIQQGRIAIPRSSKPARIAENFAVWDFSLNAAEMAAISAIATPDSRLVKPGIAPAWD